MNVGYSYVQRRQRCQTQFFYTDSYINIGLVTNFSTSQLSTVFRRHRWFRLIKNWAWFINHVAGDGRTVQHHRCLEWYWYVEIMCWIWRVILGGPFRGPLVPSQTRCFEGALGLSGGQAPSGPLVIRPLWEPLGIWRRFGMAAPQNRAFSYWRHIYCGAVALPSLITSNRVSNVNIKLGLLTTKKILIVNFVIIND